MNEEYQEQLQQRLYAIRERISEAARHSGRAPDEITLCAACKTRSVEEIAFSAGLAIDCFGENHAQELDRNFSANAYLGKPAHFIGHLQTNKVKKTVGRAELIQSVDSTHLLDALDNCASSRNLVQKILLEINIGNEANKSGIPAAESERLLEYASGKSSLLVCGIMTIPPVCENEAEARRYFESMRCLFEQLRRCQGSNIDLHILSMGMSADYEAAILEGSTMVRIGSAIYGPRNYTK